MRKRDRDRRPTLSLVTFCALWLGVLGSGCTDDKPASARPQESLIGDIASTLAAATGMQLTQAKEQLARLQVKTLSGAAQLFRVKHGRMPANIGELGQYTAQRGVPLDPWGEPYLIDVDGHVSSKGADKQAGTADDIR